MRDGGWKLGDDAYATHKGSMIKAEFILTKDRTTKEKGLQPARGLCPVKWCRKSDVTGSVRLSKHCC